MPRPIDLSIIKEGLEYAQFGDYRVRDAINKVVAELQNDLDDVGFEPAPQTIDAIKELEDLYLSIETDSVKPKRDKKVRLDEIEDIEEHPARRKTDTIEELVEDVIEFRPRSGTRIVDPNAK